ncbi:hypothetical protein VOLCADRAFT_92964 [Volvox carteri f. nagariensis]|uniref:CRM domain-containing protein n=1 Tax=Volvox carteri f. nagariensis TaxID=3068 RepID=D8U0Z3_VOLCA|nr:uncharacterized protein VOLCADRAFT_92964 [Volvox carteri f. nagariensis]EFJ46467.1 hypothetical protein VOLCADRAFT_92964 [Volvox carteri f. nagariensis]|eukprot:XP_002952324.1 hypothetical protein VOLCADRAFT_92964 [Volvox carteri f. nagariensis]
MGTSSWMSGSGGAAAATSPGGKMQEDEAPPAPPAGGPMERIPILPPRHRHQLPLPRDVSKSLWRTAEELAAAGKLLRLQVGKSGVTRALMARAGHLLEHHQLIRVSLLQNCLLDVRFVAWLAENALDCQCIKVKGRTATLFSSSDTSIYGGCGDHPAFQSIGTNGWAGSSSISRSILGVTSSTAAHVISRGATVA